jgi:hypothetical protein
VTDTSVQGDVRSQAVSPQTSRYLLVRVCSGKSTTMHLVLAAADTAALLQMHHSCETKPTGHQVWMPTSDAGSHNLSLLHCTSCGVESHDCSSHMPTDGLWSPSLV